VPLSKPPRHERRDHRAAVGGLWEKIGALQFDYLVARGLRPEHRLLDVGCGSLRGGVRSVRYLDVGHYFGVDADPKLLDAGRVELDAAGLADRRVSLRHSDAFEVDFGVQFDFVLAQSVFTHLSLNAIRVCLARVAPCLAPGGQFYATFFRAPADPFKPVERDRFTTYYDRDPFHYPVEHLEWAAGGAGLTMTDLGQWSHPRGQEMLLYARLGRALRQPESFAAMGDRDSRA
jgi:SAM-dependent methyltransferase